MALTVAATIKTRYIPENVHKIPLKIKACRDRMGHTARAQNSPYMAATPLRRQLYMRLISPVPPEKPKWRRILRYVTWPYRPAICKMRPHLSVRVAFSFFYKMFC